MATVFRKPNTKHLHASVYLWDERLKTMARKRLSMGTDDETAAQALADSMEQMAKTAKALAGQTISTRHAEGLLTTLLSTAGISIVGNEPLPDLKEFVTKYCESRRSKASENTYRRYRTYSNAFQSWLNALKLQPPPTLDWMTNERAEDYYLHLRESLAFKTANESFKWVSRAFGRACEITRLAKNPLASVELDSKGQSLERLPFSLTEAKKLIKWLLKQGTREREWARLVMLSLMSGCRMEDAITMDQKSIEGGVLSYVQTKTGKSISCPLVVGGWLDVISETRSGPVSPALFVESKYSKSLSSEFTELVSKAGIDQEFREFKSGRKIARKTFHSLRHTLRTAIASSGGSDAQADIILGHSVGMGRRYVHSEIESMRATLKKAIG
jgi:integrase